MKTLSKALNLIQPNQPVPNFVVRLESFTTDFQTFKANQWTVLFTHPEYFIPKKIYDFKKFLEFQSFLIQHNAKLLGLNPKNARLFNEDYTKNSLGKYCKIIVADPNGIVRSMVTINKVNYRLIESILKSAQNNQPNPSTQFSILKTDQMGFPSVHLFYLNKQLN